MSARPCFALISTLLISACATNTPVNGDYFAVLPESEALHSLEQCSRSAPEHVQGTWLPSASIVQALENHLPTLENLAPKAGLTSEIANPKAYRRQYVGLVIDGHRFIYINAMTTSIDDKNWRNVAVRACDGGSSFWGALYDPATKTFSALSSNGAF